MRPVSPKMFSKTDAHSSRDYSDSKIDISFSAPRPLYFGLPLLTVPAPTFKLLIFLSVSVKANNKRFRHFVSCTVSSLLAVHLTQGRFLWALYRPEDIPLAYGLSQHYGISLGKHFQIFPRLKEASSLVLERFLSRAHIERIFFSAP